MAGIIRTDAVLPLVGRSTFREDEDMLSVHCPRHNSEVLLSNSRVRGIDQSDGGMTVRWECYCGHRGTHHRRITNPL
jgi:hypothetical protein